MKTYAQRREAEARRHAAEARRREPEDHRRLFPVARNLAEVEYRFARNMNYIPHSYTLRRNWERDADFAEAISAIDDYHYVESFRGYKYRRIAFNGYVYWGSAWKPLNWPDGSPATQLINRRRQTYQSPFDEVAPVFDEGCGTPEHRASSESVCDIVREKLGDGDTVLDIGCGTGFLLDRFDIPPEQYTGIDTSHLMLRRLAAKHPAHVDSVEVCSFEEWYPPERYDLAVGLFGAGSWILPEYLSKLPMLLEPGGRWILMTYDDPICDPARQPTWKRFGVAEYLHDNQAEIDSLGQDECHEVGYHRVCIGSRPPAAAH